MILYLGTSSLAKLYFKEQHSDTIKGWVHVAEAVATCRIAYTEMISALDLRYKGKDLTMNEYESVVKKFSKDWAHFAKIDFDDYDAGLLVKKYGLKRFGAIHLSAAKLLKTEQKKLLPLFKTLYRDHTDVSLFFSSVDEKLCRAASAEGLNVLPLY